jgi:hypothetical protein
MTGATVSPSPTEEVTVTKALIQEVDPATPTTTSNGTTIIATTELLSTSAATNTFDVIGELTPPKPKMIPPVVQTRSNSIEDEGNNVDNRENMINDDITLFEAWFDLMTTKNGTDKVNVDQLADKVSTSGLFTFNKNSSNFLRKTEEKAIKEELLDQIEEDFGLNVMGYISIDDFFQVIVRYPRYVHRLKRAAGDTSDAPKVWAKPPPRDLSIDDRENECEDELDPFEDEENGREKKNVGKLLKRTTWKNSFKDLFQVTSFNPAPKKKKNPKRLSKQSSSFYDKCRSIRAAFTGKSSVVKVFSQDEDPHDDDYND